MRPSKATMAQFRAAVWLCAVAVLIAVLAAADSAQPRNPARLRLAPCTIGAVSARCGFLPVPENRAGNTDREIMVRVAVVPAQSAVPRSDPVFWLAGGPGAAATGDLPDAVQWLWALNLTRDLVFVDQRGTGESRNLVCPQGADAGRWAGELRACLAGLPADPAAYTTAWAMDDLDDVRAALGYSSINVYGGSYGATAAQVYVQRHPTRVRSATLIGGTLLEIPIFERMPATSQRALESVFARCAGDPVCHAAYPDPAADLRKVAARLDQGPVELPLNDPATGEPAQLTRQALDLGVHSLLRDPRTAVLIPKLLHSASRGAWSEVLETAPPSTPSSGPPTWQLMSLTIMCHEPWARLGAAETTAASAGSYLSYADIRALTVPEGICAATPVPDPSAIYAAPVRVPVPMMFINGELDPQDPPGNVASATGTYPGSVTLTAIGEGHQFAGTGCLAGVIQAFIDSGSPQGLPAACLAQPPEPSFAVD